MLGVFEKWKVQRLSYAAICILAFLFLQACAHTGARNGMDEETSAASAPEKTSTEAPDPDEGSLKRGLAEEEALYEDEDYDIGLEEDEEEFAEEEDINDPIEPWNRAVFVFNDKAYFWVLKPVARGYKAVFPTWVRQRVRNFFDHLTMPIAFVNSLLQFKGKKAGIDLSRFLLNTTAGVAGLFDVAKTIDLESSDEDFGQTLAFYGLGDGLFIVWPLLGPSSLRDTTGRIGDGLLYPVNYIGGAEVVLGVRAYESINEVSLTIGDYEDFKEAAIDPYTAMRNAYFQHREDQIGK